MPEAKARIVIFFKEEDDTEPVKVWLEGLKNKRKIVEYQKILSQIDRARLGNFGDHRFLGGAFGELKINFGPGYRVYFGVKGNDLIVLLGGGSKESQPMDIELARSRWEKYLKEVEDSQNAK